MMEPYYPEGTLVEILRGRNKGSIGTIVKFLQTHSHESDSACHSVTNTYVVKFKVGLKYKEMELKPSDFEDVTKMHAPGRRAI